MYAAAGGASIASRQARQRQKLNKQKALTAGLKTAPGGGSITSTGTAVAPPKIKFATPASQSKQFHQLPSHYYNQTHHIAKAKVDETQASAAPAAPKPDVKHSYSLPKDCRICQQCQSCQTCACDVERWASCPPAELDAKPFEDVDGKLERRCSVRHRGDASDDSQMCATQNKYNHLLFDVDAATKSCEANCACYMDAFEYDSLDYPFSECSQGRTAWQEREREQHGLLSDTALAQRAKQSEAHLRWLKRNQIHALTHGDVNGACGSEENLLYSVLHPQSAAANSLLYIGLGAIVIGAVIFFVGTGEKGFKTTELRMIGPTLVAVGFICCVLRVLLCVCPSTCFRKTRVNTTRGKHGHERCPTEDDDAHYHISSSDVNSMLVKQSNQIESSQTPASFHTLQTLNAIATIKKRVSIQTFPPSTRVFVENERAPTTFPRECSMERLSEYHTDVQHLQADRLQRIDETNAMRTFQATTNHQRIAAQPRVDSLIELNYLENQLDDIISVSSEESILIDSPATRAKRKHTDETKLNRVRAPLNKLQETNHLLTSSRRSDNICSYSHVSNNSNATTTGQATGVVDKQLIELVLNPSQLQQQ